MDQTQLRRGACHASVLLLSEAQNRHVYASHGEERKAGRWRQGASGAPPCRGMHAYKERQL